MLMVIGYLNHRHQFLSTVFVAYLATDEYSREYVVGMKARAWPAFPRAYRGGIPCCAGRLEAISEPLIARLG